MELITGFNHQECHQGEREATSREEARKAYQASNRNTNPEDVCPDSRPEKNSRVGGEEYDY